MLLIPVLLGSGPAEKVAEVIRVYPLGVLMMLLLILPLSIACSGTKKEEAPAPAAPVAASEEPAAADRDAGLVPIAAPMVGGMVSATLLTLVVVPVIYFIWQGAAVARAEAGEMEDLGSPELALAPGGD